MSAGKKKSRIKKIARFVAVFTVVIVLAAVSSHFLVDHFERDIFDWVIKKIQENSGGLYIINYDQVDLDLFKRSIHLRGLSVDLDPDVLSRVKTWTPKSRTLIKTALPVFSVEGVSITGLLFSRSLNIDIVSAADGRLELLKIKAVKSGSGSEKKTVKRAFPFRAVQIKRLDISKTSFKLIEFPRDAPVLSIKEASLLLSKLRIRPRPVIGFKAGEFTLKEPSFTFPQGFYTLSAREINLSKLKSFITIDALRLDPGYSEYRFARERGYRTNRLSLKIDRIELEDIDFNEFYKNQRFHSRLATIKKPDLEIYRDKNAPRGGKPKKKKFPQQLLKELAFGVRMDTLNVAGGSVVYKERAEGQKRRVGAIYFSDINMELKNLTNYPELLKKKTAMVLNVTTRLMGKSKLEACLAVPLSDRRLSFTFSGSLGRIDMKEFNSMLRDNAFLRIDRGIIDGLYFFFRADYKKAEGQLKLYYNDLRLSVFNRGGKRKRKWMMSFLANTIIREGNPRQGQPLRVGKIYYERNKPVSFLNYIFKALVTGIKSSIGLKKSKKK